MRQSIRLCSILTLVVLGTLGCRSGMPSTEFLNPRFDFAFVERVAVLPFENLTNDLQAGARATRLTVTELLASGSVDVVEYGEVRAALESLPSFQPGQSGVPSTQEIVALGQALEVQAVILGSVTQSENLRSGTVAIPVVTIDMHMVEAETGSAVWAATNSTKGATMSARVLGTGGEPLSATTRRCVQDALRALID